MRRFNLSTWSLQHPTLVLYAILSLTLIGIVFYGKLGQSEDPPFTFKSMVVQTAWPGASAREVEQQVTDRLEKKLQEIAWLDHLRSYSRPGQSIIYLIARDSTPPSEIASIWYQVRKKIGDIKHLLPNGVEGPYFNDEFGDVYGNLYALTGEHYDYAELKRQADIVRAELLHVPDVAKVNFFGEQEQRIYIDLSNAKLITLGIDIKVLLSILKDQNLVTSSGSFDTSHEHIRIATSGRYDQLERIRDIRVRAHDREIRLGDVSKISHGYADPPRDRVRYKGQNALLIGVSMQSNGDIIKLGRNLDLAFSKIQKQLPIGLELHTVSSQHKAVQNSIHEFVKTFAEAVFIVLLVSLLSLGFRTGIIVAINIPVVLAITFLFMYLFDVGLHKISLGALIIALGLLVDDAIIAAEMMASKIEQGWERARAAAFTYTSTAMPMLSGTLITAAGFLPIATATSSTGEYTYAIFQVIVISLLISWFAAVIFVPYLGYYLLPNYDDRQSQPPLKKYRLVKFFAKLKTRIASWTQADSYNALFYQHLRRIIKACITYRWVVIAFTLLLFISSLVNFKFIEQQFFPASTRLELIVDLRLAESASLTAVEDEVKKLEAWLDNQDGIENYVSYVGNGSPRFYLPMLQQLSQRNIAQIVILTTDFNHREQVRSNLIEVLEKDFFSLHASVSRLENGPPVGFPVQFRVSGPEFDQLRNIAYKVANIMRDDSNLSNVQLDWSEPIKVVQIEVNQSKARSLDVSSHDLANLISGALQGIYVTEFREGSERIAVMVRGIENERKHLSSIENLMVPTPSGNPVSLSQIAKINYDFEEGIIGRRNRIPTIFVRANVYGKIQAPTVSKKIDLQLQELRKNIPLGYRIETGGTLEESIKGQKSVAFGIPLLLFCVLTILMIQLQNVSWVFLVLLTAPLGLIGVSLFLLLFGKPLGFVAMLGTIALSGMIMRNSLILINQINQNIKAGLSEVDAIVESTIQRFRPIALTAAATVLAMIPLTQSTFFGPMAVAIMGGLSVATLLSLLLFPAMYAAWCRIG